MNTVNEKIRELVLNIREGNEEVSLELMKDIIKTKDEQRISKITKDL